MAVEAPEAIAFRGMMLSGVPNFAFAIGYTNSSWTLKVDLVCEHLCRLMSYMDARGLASVTPVNDDPAMETRPLLDFKAGYVTRALDQMPKQGPAAPWQLPMDYRTDLQNLVKGPIVDPALRFTARADLAVPASVAA